MSNTNPAASSPGSAALTVTAETITDEQIARLREHVLAQSPRFVDDDTIIQATCWALGESRWCGGVDCRIPHGMEAQYRRDGRARCAAAYNTLIAGGAS